MNGEREYLEVIPGWLVMYHVIVAFVGAVALCIIALAAVLLTIPLVLKPALLSFWWAGALLLLTLGIPAVRRFMRRIGLYVAGALVVLACAGWGTWLVLNVVFR